MIKRMGEKCRFGILAFLDESGVVWSGLTKFLEGGSEN